MSPEIFDWAMAAEALISASVMVSSVMVPPMPPETAAAVARAPRPRLVRAVPELARSESFVGCEKVSSGIDPAEGPRAIGFKKLANGAIGGGKGPDFIGGKDIRSFKADVVGTVSYQLVKAQFARGFQQSCPRSYKKAGSSL